MSGYWDARIRRATELSSVYPFASEGLRFYSRVAAAQQSLYHEFEQAARKHACVPVSSSVGSLRDELDVAATMPRFCGFLETIEPIAPAPLARAASTLAQKGSATWHFLIAQFWRGRSWLATENEADATGVEVAERSLVWLFLQPYAEYLAERHDPVFVEGTPSNCPLCGAKPIVAVLRPEGDGAKKSLVCMLCAHEWAFRRIFCPACGEEREPLMAFYSAPEMLHVRVDVCETCRTYLKSVDLTKTGRAIPLIDELASLPLDLWARDNGYRKLQMNMLGM
jgi:formate dehydrogenase accessory protein FdhE